MVFKVKVTGVEHNCVARLRRFKPWPIDCGCPKRIGILPAFQSAIIFCNCCGDVALSMNEACGNAVLNIAASCLYWYPTTKGLPLRSLTNSSSTANFILCTCSTPSSVYTLPDRNWRKLLVNIYAEDALT